MECKSYLDSGGVHAAHFLPGAKYSHRYKLFHDEVLRDVVLHRLKLQFTEAGLCRDDTSVRLGLVLGHATKGSWTSLCERFKNERWLLFGADWLRKHLDKLSKAGYENSTAAIVAKIFLKTNGSSLVGLG